MTPGQGLKVLLLARRKLDADFRRNEQKGGKKFNLPALPTSIYGKCPIVVLNEAKLPLIQAGLDDGFMGGYQVQKESRCLVRQANSN